MDEKYSSLYPACAVSQLGFMSKSYITPSQVKKWASDADVDPLIVMAIVESEFAGGWYQTAWFSSGVLRTGSRIVRPNAPASLGVAQMQQRNILRTIMEHPVEFTEQLDSANAALRSEWDIGQQIHENDALAVKVATYFVADMQADIENTLNSRGITIGNGGCDINSPTCEISDDDFFKLMFIAYNQAWNNPDYDDDLFDRLVKNRGTSTYGWYEGITATIERNPRPGRSELSSSFSAACLNS